MSIWGQRVSATAIAVVVLFLLVGTLLAAVGRVPAREITLVAKGMAFYLESDPATPNPTITVKPGERIRIVLRNEDPGFVHDFSVPILDTAVDHITWNKASAATFDMPATPGTYEYVCNPHALMMRGRIVARD